MSGQPPINNKVVEVLVKSVLSKNGVKADEVKRSIPEEQKKMLREMVEDLKRQVEEFQQSQKEENSE
ncbi:spore coat protein [Oceanobacillus luteolus]|uniref:Spore coat protein n=1 Tax=Oceanobacillus luteolus TaxID=1274358 RepID=A0ABW4HYN6_9BACI|nr:spore coat protein [Oceanobacillus luteolus]MCM3740861.1 spore coat protein [Oceanobacillus luteolus]